jgi:hypothetical protein
MITNQLSGGTFNEKLVEEKKSASLTWQRSRYLVSDGSESEAEPDQDRQHYRSEVETRAMSEGQFKVFGRIEKKFYILCTKQGPRRGTYGEVYAKCFEV